MATKKSDEIKVPDSLKGKTVWTVPPKFKQTVPGRFEIDKCTAQELEYLQSKGLLKG